VNTAGIVNSMNETTPENGPAGRDLLGHAYEPPRITALGTLADLTAGGDVPAPEDVMGGAAGDEGSL
jgi:hypothetical protein